MSETVSLSKQFEQIGEHYAAGFYENEGAPLFVRHARAMRRYLERCRLVPYAGEALYPVGKKPSEMLVAPSYSFTVEVQWSRLSEKAPALVAPLRRDLDLFHSLVPDEHAIGGNMYTHSYPNFKRIIAEGLDSYEARVRKIEAPDVREGLLDLLLGIRAYHGRILEMLRASSADPALSRALERVPMKPAETLYEAIVCWNFVYYLDGCDNIGRPDADLIPYHRGEDVTALLRLFFKNVDANNGWSGAVGPDYNPLTLQCIKAVKGLRRPSLELRVTREMPKEIWDAALESICAGGGSPNLYNEQGYQSALARLFPDIPEADRLCFAGGGCTETMLAGLSNVGSIDAGINVALIFERFMRSELAAAPDFEVFYSAFLQKYAEEAKQVLHAVSESQRLRAEYRPHPMRTLLVDDCIDKGRDFNAGGARYYWSIVNLAGIINVLDSLLTIKHLVFEGREMSGKELLACLDRGESFRCRADVPRHGTDSDEANALAHRLSADLTKPLSEVKPYLGGVFMPASIQFMTFVYAGAAVGATPDGRGAHAPLCDSIGAIHGNDQRGITALLNSASSISQSLLLGTPVLNLRLDATAAHTALPALVQGYFENGGMQLQITCVSRADLLRAHEHPEEYPNLVVRVGGYSEYFGRLAPELRQTVIDRTEYV